MTQTIILPRRALLLGGAVFIFAVLAAGMSRVIASAD